MTLFRKLLTNPAASAVSPRKRLSFRLEPDCPRVSLEPEAVKVSLGPQSLGLLLKELVCRRGPAGAELGMGRIEFGFEV